MLEQAAERSANQAPACTCPAEYLCSHNKSSTYAMRKPSREVVQAIAKARKLKACGRVSDGRALLNEAKELDKKNLKNWRDKIARSMVHSEWGVGRCQVEIMMKRHLRELNAQSDKQENRWAILERQKQDAMHASENTSAAEERKVKRRLALASRERDRKAIQEVMVQAAEVRQLIQDVQSKKLNVSENMIHTAEHPQLGIRKEEEWKPPSFSGLSNSSALISHDQLYRKAGTESSSEWVGGVLGGAVEEPEIDLGQAHDSRYPESPNPSQFTGSTAWGSPSTQWAKQQPQLGQQQQIHQLQQAHPQQSRLDQQQQQQQQLRPLQPQAQFLQQPQQQQQLQPLLPRQQFLQPVQPKQTQWQQSQQQQQGAASNGALTGDKAKTVAWE
ncbi:unnamed protein product, partial [Chrysoparadoxa australica]